MTEKRSIIGIDSFRIVAAILIVGIHTTPLNSFSSLANYLIFEVLGRVAVPFFLMVTGYYVVSDFFEPGLQKKTRFLKSEKKLALLYLAAMILYLPVQIYNGSYREWTIGGILKDLIFDGTFYHLWYLPAAMLGLAMLYLLAKKCSKTVVLGISIALYVIGLFGDSYYGIIDGVPGIDAIYDGMFHLFDYTRNGLFLAPVFLMLGVLVKDRLRILGYYRYVGLGISLFLLIIEGILLSTLELQRHDSMYLCLLPTMIFLFVFLVRADGIQSKGCRVVSLVVYLIHPFILVLLRGVAKAAGLTKYLVDQSLVCFLCVAILSFGVAMGGDWLYERFRPRSEEEKGRAWIEINLDHLTHNVEVLQSILHPRTKLMAVVKANAYGHGDVLVASHLQKLGIRAYAVATLEEGIHLRQHGIHGVILILGYTHPEKWESLLHYRLTQTVFDHEYAKELDSHHKKIHVHIKIDTGMHRLGERSDDITDILKIFTCSHLSIDGMYSHLCSSDSLKQEDVEYTNHQITAFLHVVDLVKKAGYRPGKIHIQSSYGILNYPDLEMDYVRAGISLYGVMSQKADHTRVPVKLEPVLSIKARVVMTKEIKAGESVGYGRQYVADREMRIAVISIGYADGINRELSNGAGQVLLHGVKVPIIGRICMDQLMLDVTEVEEVHQDDIALLIGNEGTQRIVVEDMAQSSNTITNEVLSRLGSRLPRVAGV